MKKAFINKKLEFLISHLESLKDYKDSSLDELKDKPKDLKYIEKLIQELVDCAVDINQFVLENLASEKSWSAKQSFWDMENKILKKQDMGFGQEDLNLFIDTVSFRNEIVHSYDVNIYIVWSKRNIRVIIDLYQKYIGNIMKLHTTESEKL